MPRSSVTSLPSSIAACSRCSAAIASASGASRATREVEPGAQLPPAGALRLRHLDRAAKTLLRLGRGALASLVARLQRAGGETASSACTRCSSGSHRASSSRIVRRPPQASWARRREGRGARGRGCPRFPRPTLRPHPLPPAERSSRCLTRAGSSPGPRCDARVRGGRRCERPRSGPEAACLSARLRSRPCRPGFYSPSIAAALGDEAIRDRGRHGNALRHDASAASIVGGTAITVVGSQE